MTVRECDFVHPHTHTHKGLKAQHVPIMKDAVPWTLQDTIPSSEIEKYTVYVRAKRSPIW